MRIDELFDKPLPLEWEKVQDNFVRASFQIDDQIFEIEFNEEHVTEEIYGWQISFGLEGMNHFYHTRKDPGSMSRDFKHKTVLVFSTVLSAIDKFFDQEKPETLYLAASSNRQDKMYDRLMKYFNSVNLEYHIARKYDPGGNGNYYEITK